MAKMTPVHPGNGNLHWGDRLEVPRATDWEDHFLAVPVTLLRPKGDLVMDRLRNVVWTRATRTHRFTLQDLQEMQVPDSPEGAKWTAWVKVETR